MSMSPIALRPTPIQSVKVASSKDFMNNYYKRKGKKQNKDLSQKLSEQIQEIHTKNFPFEEDREPLVSAR